MTGTGLGQGTVFLDNFGLNPVLDVDGAPAGSVTPLNNLRAAFWFNDAVVSEAWFFDAGQFLNPTGVGVEIPGAAAGSTVNLQVVAWDSGADYNDGGGLSFADAVVKGVSEPFEVALGGAGSPPSLPGTLANMQSFGLVPEPSTLALGVLGGGLLLALRRRK